MEYLIEKGVEIPNKRTGRPKMLSKLTQTVGLMEPGDSMVLRTKSELSGFRAAVKRRRRLEGLPYKVVQRAIKQHQRFRPRWRIWLVVDQDAAVQMVADWANHED
jgi:hypothetical protein